jgi:hypothetical protein
MLQRGAPKAVIGVAVDRCRHECGNQRYRIRGSTLVAFAAKKQAIPCSMPLTARGWLLPASSAATLLAIRCLTAKRHGRRGWVRQR